MEAVLHIDPNAWIFTFPLLLGLAQVWRLPSDHLIKRVGHEMTRREAQAWEWLGWPGGELGSGWGASVRQGLAIVAMAGLALATSVSFAAYLGWIPMGG
jgi:hypothetical protein